MKKFVQWILLLCLIPGLLCPIGLQVAADAPVHQGSCGEALLWSYDTATASLSIEGLGAMEDYVYNFFGLSGSDAQWDTVEKTQARMPEEYILHSSAAGDEVSQIETPNGAYLYCRLCCQALTPVPECSHSDTSKINEIAPTCTGHGYSGDLCCTLCGEILSYGESLPPLGHQFENNACIRCGLIDPQSNPFSDVSSSDYFFDPVLWAVNKGITTGTDETHFSPEGACTRGQIVTFLYRANS